MVRTSHEGTGRLRRVVIRNYKSLAQVAVDLDRLTVLVGPNGAGKSNFVDALAFVHDCLSESIELAFKTRGGIAAVRRRSPGRPTHVGVSLYMDLPGGVDAHYAFKIVTRGKELFAVEREQCVVGNFMGQEHSFELRQGEFRKPITGMRPKLTPDRLALYAASGTDEFRPVYDFLTQMRSYSISPERLREPQEPDPGDSLKRDGSNAAAVLRRIQREASHEARYERVCSLLSKVVDGLEGVEYRSMGQKETFQFRQDVGQRYAWTFDALSMSDGTLRVLGLLLAVYQPRRPSLLAAEEPEATVHPAVTELLLDVLMDAANDCQIVLTTHSPDLLDSKTLDDTQIRSVVMRKGATIIAPVVQSTRAAIRDQLYTPGELLRVDELHADVERAERDAEQVDLFQPQRAQPEDAE